MADHGRDELIDAKRERDRLVAGIAAMGTAIEKLMDDRVRHLEALREIVAMTETGVAMKGGHDIYRVAVRALGVGT
jgi:hypothetical protein